MAGATIRSSTALIYNPVMLDRRVKLLYLPSQYSSVTAFIFLYVSNCNNMMLSMKQKQLNKDKKEKCNFYNLLAYRLLDPRRVQGLVKGQETEYHLLRRKR